MASDDVFSLQTELSNRVSNGFGPQVWSAIQGEMGACDRDVGVLQNLWLRLKTSSGASEDVIKQAREQMRSSAAERSPICRSRTVAYLIRDGLFRPLRVFGGYFVNPRQTQSSVNVHEWLEKKIRDENSAGWAALGIDGRTDILKESKNLVVYWVNMRQLLREVFEVVGRIPMKDFARFVERVDEAIGETRTETEARCGRKRLVQGGVGRTTVLVPTNAGMLPRGQVVVSRSTDPLFQQRRAWPGWRSLVRRQRPLLVTRTRSGLANPQLLH